ncbi:MAG: MotA/TolQ/ExbB proton channel family protein [Candidatus Brocadiia bacterium]
MTKTRMITGVIAKVTLALFLVTLSGGIIYAEPPAVPETTMIDLIKAGSWVGHFIIVVSMVGLGLGIEHIINIRKIKLCPPEIVAELESLVDNAQYEDAIALCNANPNFFCNIIGASLAKINEGYDAMTAAMGEAGEEEAAKMNQKISYMSLVGNIAPMLGLTGTVTGMIAAFGIIKATASPSPAMLAKGVEEALVTTAEGLFVSMPALTAYFYYKNKVTMYVLEIGALCGEFLEKFKDIQPAEQQ